MSLSLAIVGRPNVGKSTLFNRLAGKKLAIVDRTSGVTRDRREAKGKLGDLDLTLIDTAGFGDYNDDSLEARMRKQTNQAVEQADVALFLVDARTGITPFDEYFANWLRRQEIPIILVANKCEGSINKYALSEALRLGLGEPIAISAEHGEGMGSLYDSLAPFIEDYTQLDGGDLEDDIKFGEILPDKISESPLHMAIVGRPNVGKSTLANQIIGEERLLVGPEAGITRDAITVQWDYEGRPIRLIDTAGLRRKSRVTDKVESLSTSDTHRAIQFAQVVVLVLDANTMLEKQDLTIAGEVIDEGRILVVAVNKWDSVKNRASSLKDLEYRLQTSLPQIRGVPVVILSALTGKGVQKLLPESFKYFDIWNQRIPTGQLNRWLEVMLERHPPPLVSGHRIRLRYMTQAKTRPPTFVVFSSRGNSLPEAYRRYLVNGIRERFELPGIPIRLLVRQGNNPYK
jgi:GTP-binding protein